LNATALLGYLGQTFQAVGTPELVSPTEKWNGAKWYSVEIMDVQSVGAQYQYVHYYVVDEGLETEAAYLKSDMVPPEYITRVATLAGL
jgi:hypothetical protein